MNKKKHGHRMRRSYSNSHRTPNIRRTSNVHWNCLFEYGPNTWSQMYAGIAYTDQTLWNTINKQNMQRVTSSRY